MSRYDIFPVKALAVLGALEGKTVEEMAQSILEQEEEIAIKDHAPLEGSLDYDLYVIDSQNADTTHEQLRDCMKDAIEQIIRRLKKLEEE